jgi:hypothetical protein
MSKPTLRGFCRDTDLFFVLSRYCTASLGDGCPMFRHGLVFPSRRFTCQEHSTVDNGGTAVFQNIGHQLSNEGVQEGRTKAVIIENIRRTSVLLNSVRFEVL